ncbi:MAG: N-acetyltransferase [Nocardioidaceae bacterium]|nr:MAG: N-acetyltransferase [Nocardioidaceae bacterium]
MELHLADNPTTSRYEATIGDEVVGFAAYHRSGDTVVLPHVEVRPEYGGRGIASALARFALDDIRTAGLQVMPVCPFVKRYIETHAAYQDLIAVSVP